MVPMIYEQYVVRPEAPRVKQKNPDVIKVNKEEFLIGAGIVRAIPGPVFSVSAFTGAIILKDEGKNKQWLGGMIGMIAIFLPSALLVLFFYPVWNNLKKYTIFYRALSGINATVVGILVASTIYLLHDVSLIMKPTQLILNALVVIATFVLLRFTNIKSPIIVVMCLLLGALL